jgi:ParB family chromosome partitioning protein
MSEEINLVRKQQKKGLGRGLGSLLGEANSLETDVLPNTSGPLEAKIQTTKSPMTTPVAAPAGEQIPETARIWTVGIEKVIPNKEQPRKFFEPNKLQELANSIKAKGVLLPIVVRKIEGGKFEIVAGERRWRASQLAGIKDVPIIIKNAERAEALELALIENIQRQDLNPLEEAEAYLQLTSRYGLTQQQVADRVGKDRVTVANLLRLMGLTAEVKALVRNGELQLGQAKVLLAIQDPAAQTKLAKKVVQLRLSVRATEKLVAKFNANESDELEIEEPQVAQRDLRPIMSELQKIFGTKVDVDSFKDKTKITFHFYSIVELNQYLDKVRRAVR